MKTQKLIVGLVGMPGSGKSIVVGTAQEKGYIAIIMGDIVREETKKRQLELNPKNIGFVMLDLRKARGAGVVAEMSVSRINQSKSEKIIIDGLRSLDEAEVFKANFPSFTLIAVHASPETRFNRLIRRHRSDDPDNWSVFLERDLRELRVGLGNTIAMAEYIIINEGNMKDTKEKIAETLTLVEEKWTK